MLSSSLPLILFSQEAGLLNFPLHISNFTLRVKDVPLHLRRYVDDGDGGDGGDDTSDALSITTVGLSVVESKCESHKYAAVRDAEPD